MNLGIELDAVVDRLSSRLPSEFEVGMAADAAEAEAKNILRPRSVFVIPAEDSATDVSSSQLVQQVSAQTFGVLIVARNYRVSDRGAEQIDGLRACRIAVRQALIAWRPPHLLNPITAGRSSLLRYTAELMVWVEQFRTSYQFEAMPS
jgi:hypothetical protein